MNETIALGNLKVIVFKLQILSIKLACGSSLLVLLKNHASVIFLIVTMNEVSTTMNDDIIAAEIEEIQANDPTDEDRAADITASKKTRNNHYFIWTPSHNLVFMRACQMKLLHSSKGALKKEEKCQAVINYLKSRKENDFEFLEIKPKAIGEKFRKDTSVILEKYGVTKESVNLSGLSDKPPPYDDIVLNMANESRAENSKAKRAKEKIKNNKILLNAIERTGLSQQTRNSPQVPLAVASNTDTTEAFISPTTVSFSTGSSAVNDSGSSRGSSSTTNAGANIFEVTTNRIIDAIRNSNVNDAARSDENLDSERERRALELELLRASVLAKQEEASYWRRRDNNSN